MLEQDAERIRPLLRSFLLVVAVVGVGVAGYLIIGWPEHGLLDAVYMTVITLTTVGYGEVIDLGDRPAGRIFTILLLCLGVGAFLNFVSALTAFWVEGQATHMFWRRRMNRAIDALDGHIIVCGAGHTGTWICRELRDTRRPFVIVERSVDGARGVSEQLGADIPTVIGDATDDEVLLRAGIERASCVVCCLSSDQENLLVALSARLLNPELRIVSRCIDERMETKIRKAGADRVISPNRIGGLRMVSEAVRPGAVDYLDRMLRDREAGLRVESTAVLPGSGLDGAPVARLVEQAPGLHLLAVRRTDDTWVDGPPSELLLAAGMELIYTGVPDVRARVERLAGHGDTVR